MECATMMDSAGSDRPQRKMALVGRELRRYGIQIAALPACLPYCISEYYAQHRADRTVKVELLELIENLIT